MATNDFKPFAIGAGANVMSQADYLALAALLTGFQSGKASSAQVNKALRQATFIASALAQFVSDKSGADVLDDGDINAFVTKLTNGFGKQYLSRNSPFADIKADGASAVATSLENLGLKEIALAGVMSGVIDTNGYITIPIIIGGVKRTVIVQWGQANNAASATTITTYPLPFPNACLQVVACGYQISGNTQSYAVVNNLGKTQFSWNGFYANGGSAPALASVVGFVSCRYIAIGW